MAFQIITGTFSNPNEVIDALAEVWDFDAHDTTSTYHSVTWGATKFEVSSGSNPWNLKKNNASVATLPGYPSGMYGIVKASNAVLLEWTAVGTYVATVIFTSARSLADPEDVDKLTLANRNDSSSYTNTLYAISTMRNQSSEFFANYETCQKACQVYKYIHGADGYACDNAYAVRLSPTQYLSTEVSLDGETFFFSRKLAIKDE